MYTRPPGTRIIQYDCTMHVNPSTGSDYARNGQVVREHIIFMHIMYRLASVRGGTMSKLNRSAHISPTIAGSEPVRGCLVYSYQPDLVYLVNPKPI